MHQMAEQIIKQIHYLEDSDDEVFLSKLLLETEKMNVELIHYPEPEPLKSYIENRKKDEVTLALVDLNMPKVKGTEFIKMILNPTPPENLIIGICSGSEDPADKRNSDEVRARFFVQKPLDSRCLESVCELCPELELREGGNGEKFIAFVA